MTVGLPSDARPTAVRWPSDDRPTTARIEKIRKKQSWSQMIDLVMTINSVQKSSKTELSSTLFGLFKVLAIERPERAEKCTS